MLRRLLILSVGVVPLLLASALPAQAAPAPRTLHAFATLYGWVDNSPPGNGTSAGSGHAGGVGTFANPLTFATDVAELPYNTKIYYPFLKKYFVHQDECTECDSDWKHLHKYRIDFWAGGDKNSVRNPEKAALLSCEDSLTRGDGSYSAPFIDRKS